MAISLKKGDSASLGNSLQYGVIALGWDINKHYNEDDYDLDAEAFMVGRNGKVVRESDFVFYGNLISSCGSLRHTGDDKGEDEKEGDREMIIVKFAKIPKDVEKIVFTVTMYEADIRRQDFGQIDNAYVRFIQLKDPSDTRGTELVRYNLSRDYGDSTSIVVCELKRSETGWRFNAVGEGYPRDLEFLCGKYGVVVSDK